jgi:hypothetical protein
VPAAAGRPDHRYNWRGFSTFAQVKHDRTPGDSFHDHGLFFAKEHVMNKRVYVAVAACALGAAGFAVGQGRILDMVAQKVIGKYQSSSCEQLWQQKGAPKSPEEQKAVQFLKNDAQARTAFINQVAAPIANKMFECGMIP